MSQWRKTGFLRFYSAESRSVFVFQLTNKQSLGVIAPPLESALNFPLRSDARRHGNGSHGARRALESAASEFLWRPGSAEAGLVYHAESWTRLCCFSRAWTQTGDAPQVHAVASSPHCSGNLGDFRGLELKTCTWCLLSERFPHHKSLKITALTMKSRSRF